MLTNTERQQIVDEVNAGTYGIDEALDDIAAAQKGEEVRKALYAEALVLNREGHAGSTDMIARQQIANLQTSVNGQISTLRTEVGEDIDDLEAALNSGLATQNGRIAAQDATIAGVVANYNVEYGSTELWESTGETGALAAGTTVTLSEDVSHFDYIDIYSFCGNSNVLDTVPVDAKLQSSQGYALRWVNLSDPDSGSYKAYVRIIETRLHIIGTTLTIDHQVTYRNGEEVNISGAEITQSNRSTYMGELGIMKIVGRKITANTEIEDVRIGADGTEYASAGQAVRAQIGDVADAIPAIDATLSVAGAAADAKAVGDVIKELQDGGYVADQQKITEKINDWLDDHPEATTTVQDGAITNAKLDDELMGNILATNMNSIAFSAERILNFSDLNVSGLSFQCCTYDSARNHYVLAFTDDTDAKVVTISEDWETINTYGVLNAYHANDITYNPNQDKLYLATMTNNILVLNPADMSVISTIDFGEQINQIAYDAGEDVFYVGRTATSNVFYKCNNSMGKIETYSEFTLESVRELLTLDSSQTLVLQSACVVDGCLYLVAYTWDSSYEINSNGYIILITPKENYAISFSTTYAGEEPESLLLRGNMGYFMSWRHISASERQVIVYKASLSKSLAFEQNLYFRGNALHDIDLNDIIAVGNYFSKNTSATSTISNCPVTTSFTLLVRTQGYENVRQILFGDSVSDIYTRVIYPPTGYSESWYRIQMNSVNASWQTIRLSSDTSIAFYYRRISVNQVEWKLDTGGTKYPTQTTIGTLPSGFIPNSGWYFALARWINSGTQGVNALRITTNGEIQIIATDDYVHGSGIFSI